MTGFVLRAPWYVRERAGLGLLDPPARRPAIQMYDGTDVAERMIADPRDSLAFGADDRYSYPIPVTPGGTGRSRLATWQLVTTGLRKLYQPNHDRFYTVVAEVFCDQPGLPRAGRHDDIEVAFVMRRRVTSLTGGTAPQRRVATDLVRRLATEEELEIDETRMAPGDERDLWWADQAWRRRFAEDNAESLAQLSMDSRTEGWFRGRDGSRGWKPLEDAGPDDAEEQLPMWRLPPREDECDAARTRSTWFGLVPTYSSEHSAAAPGTVGAPPPRPKYDDRDVYEIHCVVRQPPPRGKEHCPTEEWWNDAPSEPFRLASPTDPQGTSKRLTSITLPDLRRLAARAGQPMGPGGVAVTTPPQSQLVVNPFGGTPGPGDGRVGAGGGVCTFALELFFVVAFFLFLMFLPIVVFAFQLWWMLALRFCIPPTVAMDLTVDFLADVDVDVNTGFDFEARVQADVGFGAYASALAGLPDPTTPDVEIDRLFGTDSSVLPTSGLWLDQMAATPAFTTDPGTGVAAGVASNPRTAVPPDPPDHEPVPDDPLCATEHP